MMKQSPGPAPVSLPWRRSWFGARFRIVNAHCRLAGMAFRILAALWQARALSGASQLMDGAPAKGA